MFVTPCSPVKTVQARVMKYLLGLPQKLVFCGKILCRCVKGFISNDGAIDGSPLKIRYFTAIGLSGIETVADKHRHAAYHNKHL